MINKIIFPTDGSETSRVAIPHVTAMAAKYNAEVIILHSVDLSFYGSILNGRYQDGGSSYVYMTQIEDKSIEYGNKILEEARQAFEGIKTSIHLEVGTPKSVIISMAEKEKCSLIIMGSRGVKGKKSPLIGSVGEYVLHHAACPVMLVN